jgi:hypothetical protein
MTETQQNLEHRVRLADSEILFLTQRLKECEKPNNDRYKKLALYGFIRKLESVRHGGKAQLRDLEAYAVYMTNLLEERANKTES